MTKPALIESQQVGENSWLSLIDEYPFFITNKLSLVEEFIFKSTTSLVIKPQY
ncbi:hypothetical protein GCM10009193_02850 [Shewanella aestuarii]|nr:hypothetical protein GCM10009193_02850 [Shewanella aestuarii]